MCFKNILKRDYASEKEEGLKTFDLSLNLLLFLMSPGEYHVISQLSCVVEFRKMKDKIHTKCVSVYLMLRSGALFTNIWRSSISQMK